jgi:hypothetical protein
VKAVVDLSEQSKSAGICEGREEAIGVVLRKLEPLREAEHFGGATAAYCEILTEVLLDIKKTACRESRLLRDQVEKSKIELRDESSALHDRSLTCATNRKR